MTYESMGKVWLEVGADDGNGTMTWSLVNGGLPLSVANAKSPSMDYITLHGNPYLAIVFQEQTSSGYKIVALINRISGNQSTWRFEIFNEDQKVVLQTPIRESPGARVSN